jgi:RNA polymerase sigma-70 factor (ECF subfamily)
MSGNGGDRLEPYLGRLFGYAISLTNDRDLALEVLQPADETAYRAWLFRILRNAAIDRWRNGTPAMQPLDDVPEIADPASVRVEESLINRLTVEAGMTSLSGAHREIIALVDIAGFSYAETATLLEVPLGTVMSRLCRARRALLAAILEHNVYSLTHRRQGGRP